MTTKLPGRFLLWCLMIYFFIIACEDKTLYREIHSLQDNTWDVNNQQIFSFNIENNQIPYDIFIHVSNTTDYPNSNLWLFIQTIAPSGDKLHDTLDYMLADKSGKWYGDCFANVCDNKVLFKKYVRFARTGPYKIKLVHGMRTLKMPHLEEIGISIEYAEIPDSQ
jgi:gliding motility-associated lipoprotein GldH